MSPMIFENHILIVIISIILLYDAFSLSVMITLSLLISNYRHLCHQYVIIIIFVPLLPLFFFFFLSMSVCDSNIRRHRYFSTTQLPVRACYTLMPNACAGVCTTALTECLPSAAKDPAPRRQRRTLRGAAVRPSLMQTPHEAEAEEKA